VDPLLSPDDFRTLTGLDVDPVRLDLLLGQASAAVRAFCGWHIAPTLTGATVTADGTGGRTLSLPTLYLTNVSAVTEHGTALDLDSVTWSEHGVIERGCAWTCRRRGVVAVIDHGYETVPGEVAAVVCSIVSRVAPNPLGVVREQTGPFSVTYSQTAFNQAGGVVLLANEKDVLAAYRIPGV
jgi:hypothetical protein